MNISTEDIPRGRGPTGTAYREGTYYFSNDIASDPRMEPWRDNALKHGYLAIAAFPFSLGTKNAGVITLYAPVTGFFDDQVINLLDELSADISFALRMLDHQDDQRAAEAALSGSENRYRSLVDGMHECVVVYRAIGDGEDFEILEFNKSAEKTEQVTREEVIGHAVTRVFPGVEEFGILDVFRRVWCTGISESFPVSLYTDNRISGWRNNFIYRLPTGEIVATYSDETARKTMEEALRRSEEKYRDLYDNAPNAYYSIGTDGRIVRCNKEAERILGIPAEDLVGKRISEFYADTPDGREKAIGLIAGFRNGKALSNEELQMKRADGRLIWIQLTVNAVRDGSGKIIESRTTIVDITDRKRTEDSLKANERRLASIYDTVSDIIFHLTVEPEGQYRFTSVNPAFCRITGIPADAVIEKTVREIIPEPSLSLVLAVPAGH